MWTQLIALVLLLGLFFGSIGLFVFGVGSIAAAFRHRLPDIPVAWVFKTRLSRANFTPRGPGKIVVIDSANDTVVTSFDLANNMTTTQITIISG